MAIGTTAAILGAAAIGAGASIYSSSKAAKAGESSAQQATDTQWAMYKQTRADKMPWLTAGTESLTKLNALVDQGPGDFKSSEYYNQGLTEANKATDAYLASRGLYASGKAGKDLQANAVALNERNRGNWLNEWITTKLNPTQSLAQVGQTAANSMGNDALATGREVGNNAMVAGDARATGYLNQSNAVTGALQGGSNALAMYYGAKNGGTDWNGMTQPLPASRYNSNAFINQYAQ